MAITTPGARLISRMLRSKLGLPLKWVLAHFRFQIRIELSRQHDADLHDIGSELQRRALSQTAEYIEQHFGRVDSVESPEALLTLAAQHVANKDGLYLEFGVFSGRTINHIAAQIDKPIYGFDSFEGLPERWRDQFGSGYFKRDGLPPVRSNVKLVKGWFDQTLPAFLLEHSEEVSFLHVDCDLYSSTKTIFDELKPRIKAGTVIVFDEYFNYPGWQQGEFKAFQEFIAETGWSYTYIGYNRFHEQASVRIGKKR